MNDDTENNRQVSLSLVQVTTRIRSDQKNRLDMESRARGETIADTIRNNLDLAFAMKAELSKIVEGEYDGNDPKNTPRLIHSLLFRVEERILGALDGLSNRIERRIVDFGAYAQRRSAICADENGETGNEPTEEYSEVEIISDFISLITDNSEYPMEVWLGAFLEIVPRLELVSLAQLGELKEKGDAWLTSLRDRPALESSQPDVNYLGNSAETTY